MAAALLLPSFLSSPSPAAEHGRRLRCKCTRSSSYRRRLGATVRVPGSFTCGGTSGGGGSGEERSRTAAVMPDAELVNPAVDCIGTGSSVECLASDGSSEADGLLTPRNIEVVDEESGTGADSGLAQGIFEWAVLVSPFFFWGTAMVAMKEVIPKAGPFFVSAFRLIPAGFLLIGFARIRGRRQPSGNLAWLSILLFGVVDAACFQVR